MLTFEICILLMRSYEGDPVWVPFTNEADRPEVTLFFQFFMRLTHMVVC